MKSRSKRRIAWLALGTLLGLAFFGWATNRAVLSRSKGKIYTDLYSVPVQPVALVLGTAPVLGGRPNAFFERRMDAAAALYHAQKIRKLLVSGDNGSRVYDEPTAMQSALVARGVRKEDIILDYAGFRTLDSVVRAKQVFGLNRVTIVTDDFHLPRALYIASERDLDAVGFQAAPLPRSVSFWTYAREVGARSLVWLDLHLLDRQPRFSGPREPIRLSSIEPGAGRS